MKEESEKAGLKLNIQKMKIMSSSPITSWQIDGETVENSSRDGNMRPPYLPPEKPICSDFGAQENKVFHTFHCLPIFCHGDGTGCHDLSFFEC